MLPVRNIRLKTANFVTADGEVVLDELGPEGFSEHRRCCQLIHRLVEAARHAGLLRLGIWVRQGFAGINTVCHAVQTGDDLRAHVQIGIGCRLTRAVFDMGGRVAHAADQPAHRALVIDRPQHPVRRQWIGIEPLVASDRGIRKRGRWLQVKKSGAAM